jgi:alpha-N-arabinofuranosidase
MFSSQIGDEILAATAQNLPEVTWQPPVKRRNGVEQPAQPAQQIRKLFYSATRDHQSGTIYLKVVNSLGTPQPVKIEIAGTAIAPHGTATTLKAEHPDATNSLQEPTKIVPATEPVDGLSTNFTRTFPPYSITVLALKTK